MTEIDTDTLKKVMDILSNPEMMSKISAIASHESKHVPIEQEAPRQVINQPMNNYSSNSKADLLMAIKPLLKENKRSKIDSVIKALTVATAVSKIKSGGQENV